MFEFTQARSTVIPINPLPSLAAFRIVIFSVHVGQSIMLTFSAYNCPGKRNTMPTFPENLQLIRKWIQPYVGKSLGPLIAQNFVRIILTQPSFFDRNPEMIALTYVSHYYE